MHLGSALASVVVTSAAEAVGGGTRRKKGTEEGSSDHVLSSCCQSRGVMDPNCQTIPCPSDPDPDPGFDPSDGSGARCGPAPSQDRVFLRCSSTLPPKTRAGAPAAVARGCRTLDGRDRRCHSVGRPDGSDAGDRKSRTGAKVDRLRQLTERLRPFFPTPPSPPPPPLPPDPVAPAVSALARLLPPIPVAPPRHPRTPRAERKKSTRVKKVDKTEKTDTATSTLDLSVLPVLPVLPALPALATKVKFIVGSPPTEVTRPSLFLPTPPSLLGDDQCAGAGDGLFSVEDDLFDDVHLTLSKLNPKILIGTYQQRTIPFRSASFSQIDVGADGTYNRRPRASIALKPLTYSSGREKSALSLPSNNNEADPDASINATDSAPAVAVLTTSVLDTNNDHQQQLNELDNATHAAHLPAQIHQMDLFNEDSEKAEELVLPALVLPDLSADLLYENNEISVTADIRLGHATSTESSGPCSDVVSVKALPVLDLLELNNHILRLKAANRDPVAAAEENDPVLDDPEKVKGKVKDSTPPPSWLQELLRMANASGQEESNSSLSDEASALVPSPLVPSPPVPEFFSRQSHQKSLSPDPVVCGSHPERSSCRRRRRRRCLSSVAVQVVHPAVKLKKRRSMTYPPSSTSKLSLRVAPALDPFQSGRTQKDQDPVTDSLVVVEQSSNPELLLPIASLSGDALTSSSLLDHISTDVADKSELEERSVTQLKINVVAEAEQKLAESIPLALKLELVTAPALPNTCATDSNNVSAETSAVGGGGGGASPARAGGAAAERSPVAPRRYGLKRRPLRGPYGEMLEAEMNKSEFSKMYTKRSEDLSFLREPQSPRNILGYVSISI